MLLVTESRGGNLPSKEDRMCRPKGYVSEKSISGKKGMKIQVHPEKWVHKRQ